MEYTFRFNEPGEETVFFAHAAECRYCPGGIVKMTRHPETFALQPDQCFCLQCGQRYFVRVDNPVVFEIEQWRQKAMLQDVVEQWRAFPSPVRAITLDS